MKILIVGGTGFLGLEIVSSLVKNGHEVKSMARNSSKYISCEQLVADITQIDSYQKEIASWKPKIVVQAAWVTDQQTYRTSPLNSSYVDSSFTFAEVCFQAGTEHFMALGSSAEYGSPTKPCDARYTPASPNDLYGISKLETLNGLMEISSRYSGKLSWARIFQPYGRLQDNARLIPQAIAKLIDGKKIDIATPYTVLDWISSRDVASALTFAIENSIDSVFDVGTGIGSSVLEVIQTLTTILKVDQAQIGVVDHKSSDRQHPTKVVSQESSLFQAGWKPQDDLFEGLTWTVTQ